MTSQMSIERELGLVKEFSQVPNSDIRQLFSAFGIDYMEAPLADGRSGEISYSNGRYQVVVNATDSDARKRFTAAHELAHYLFHRDMLNERGRLNRHTDNLFGDGKANNTTFPFTDKHEVEANKLASQILMPSDLVRQLYRKVDDNVDELAEAFGVSKRAMQIRLKVLGLRARDW